MKWLDLLALFLIIIGGFFLLLPQNVQVQNIVLPPAITPPTPKATPDLSLSYPTLTSIYLSNHSWTATLSAEHITTIIATGDVIPARSTNFGAVARNDFLWPYQKVKDKLKQGDITFINLETPLMKNCPLTTEGMIFCGDIRHVQSLVDSGVDVASVANNHAGNHRLKGVTETVNALQKVGIEVTGTNEPLAKNGIVKIVKGIKFGFLGFNDIGTKEAGISWAEEAKIKQDISDMKSRADVVIVTYHWGVEYRAQPDERQKYLGNLTIDDGADLVIGNHPHWIQPVEFYKGKLITYAHGNLVFDQMWSEETKLGVVGKYTFYDKNLIDVEYWPLQILDYGQPYWLEGEKKQKILDSMKKQSEILSASKSTLSK